MHCVVKPNLWHFIVSSTPQVAILVMRSHIMRAIKSRRSNWTTPNGALNATWQGGFAVFEGTAGTVTVSEPVSYQELQFSTTGYTLAATGTGTLSPTGVAPVIVDPGLTATISAPISGSGGLQLTGLGTLVLSGVFWGARFSVEPTRGPQF